MYLILLEVKIEVVVYPDKSPIDKFRNFKKIEP